MKNTKLLLLAVIVLLSCAGIARADLTDGLMLYYSFNDPSGAVTDESGNGHDGQVNGNAAYTADGICGGAYQFNGAPDHIIAGDLGDIPQGTISFWINPDVVENVRNPFSTNFASWDDCIRFETSGNGSNGDLVVGSLGLFAYDTGSTFTSGGLATQQWYYVVFVWDDTTNYGYLNGALVFRTPQPPADYLYPNLGQTAGYYRPFALDFRNVAIGNGYSMEEERWWKGRVDEVRIYNRPLLVTEVQQLYLGCVSPSKGYTAIVGFAKNDGDAQNVKEFFNTDTLQVTVKDIAVVNQPLVATVIAIQGRRTTKAHLYLQDGVLKGSVGLEKFRVGPVRVIISVVDKDYNLTRHASIMIVAQ